MAQPLSTFAGPGVPEGLSPRACSVPAMLADGQGQRLWRGRGPAGTHSPTWVPPAKEQRGPAEKRDTFLSPRSLESGAFSFLADMVHFDSEHLESPCLSGAGVSPPHTPLPNLRGKQNEGESVARALRCGTPPPSAAPGCPLLPALSPTHQIALRHGPGPAAFYTLLAPRVTMAIVTSPLRAPYLGRDAQSCLTPTVTEPLPHGGGWRCHAGAWALGTQARGRPLLRRRGRIASLGLLAVLPAPQEMSLRWGCSPGVAAPAPHLWASIANLRDRRRTSGI